MTFRFSHIQSLLKLLAFRSAPMLLNGTEIEVHHGTME